jgi:hypothetical protein
MTTVPLSGTNIRILSGVPFNNDYKNTRWFDTRSAQTNYFLSKPSLLDVGNFAFQRIEGSHVIRANKSIDELWGANYLMFQNTNYNSRWFYAFVTKLEYVNNGMTLIHFEIDVFQTWFLDTNFKPSFVVREHCKLWNSDGSPVVNTVDEGLNYGTEYEVTHIDNYKPYDTLQFLVIVTKATMHTGSSTPTTNKIQPSLNGSPQPLCYYIHPFKLDGTVPTTMVGGSNAGISSILRTLQSLCQQDDAGTNIVSLYVTDYFGYNATYNSSTNTLTLDGSTFETAFVSDNVNGNIQTIYVKSFPSYNELSKDFGDKYTGFYTSSESKLYMYPYTLTIIDDLKGNRSTIKNEYIEGTNLIINTMGSLGTSNKVAYKLKNYLIDSAFYDQDVAHSNQVSLEHAVISNNPNDVPILNDYLSAYLQGNRNSLENQKNAIVWNGSMGMVSNAIGGISTGFQGSPLLSGLGVLNAGASIVQGAGNTVYQLQALEAKKQDIANTPPSLLKMGSNTAFDYGNNIRGLYIIKKQITLEYRKKLEDFFKMYGYKVNEVKIPNFHTRQNWNYVQTASCIITGNLNNDDLNALKSVFDNGITFWHTDDVGNYALGNEVI